MDEKSSGKKLKKLRSDNGGEYISSEFTKYLETGGIHHNSHNSQDTRTKWCGRKKKPYIGGIYKIIII